ncbi:hypothetical protein DNH61_03590 [Paenibacillus sambharensis]|uniref:Uncharacterized protein n=1 Tax=Paenibacillus sambharensis TaxID=1803190 RepID=A0A2W1LZV2_9BACL|nr:hypothetical protein DNH61_03590 [Paenibacillus sambharensis]
MVGYIIIELSFLITMISHNVQAFMNPHLLKLPTDYAKRSDRMVEVLASAELATDFTFQEFLTDQGP